MKRLNFFSSLTTILLLLMTLGGFCIWTSQALTNDIRLLTASNYDSLSAVREVLTASTRINAACLVAADPAELTMQVNLYATERVVLQKAMRDIRATVSEQGEGQQVARMQGLIDDYLRGIDRLFALPATELVAFKNVQVELARNATNLADVAANIVKLNEDAIFGRRDLAIARGRRSNLLALGLVGVSLALYAYTSWRLAQGVFRPLRRLRDSILQVREQKFANFVPVEGSAELGQIAAAFNEMATDMRAYLLEKDERVISANRRNRAIIEVLPKPVYIVDETLQVCLMNPRAERLSQGLGVPGALPAFVRREIDQASAQTAEVGADDLRRAVEVDWAPPESGRLTSAFLPQVLRMRTEAGQPEGWAVLLMDVTTLRRLDAARSKAISTLGHEVKTPVTGIRMTLLLLLEEKLGVLNADQRELVKAGSDDCERLLAVLHALLELARLESGRVALTVVPTSVEALVEQAQAGYAGFVKNAGGELRVEFPHAEWPMVEADPLHADRVLGNFISNAVKYGVPTAPVVVRITPRADGYVRLSVINQSRRALSDDEQLKVFEPFYRCGETRAEGTGLGLTICRELATLLGGRVGVWSSAQQVEFYLDLRVAGFGRAGTV